MSEMSQDIMNAADSVCIAKEVIVRLKKGNTLTPNVDTVCTVILKTVDEAFENVAPGIVIPTLPLGLTRLDEILGVVCQKLKAARPRISSVTPYGVRDEEGTVYVSALTVSWH